MGSLGKKLKNTLNDDQKSLVNREEYRRNLIAVERFYADLKKAIVTQINKGDHVRPIKISASGTNHDVFWIFRMARRAPTALDTDAGTYQVQWQAFVRWATDNDLRIELQYHEDVMSEHDYWFELRIYPAL